MDHMKIENSESVLPIPVRNTEINYANIWPSSANLIQIFVSNVFSIFTQAHYVYKRCFAD
jgi:hypothetical protein